MCRLLMITSKETIDLHSHLEGFAQKCQESKEYQGHGWGLAIQRKGVWIRYRTLSPIWEDDLTQFKTAKFALIHARSAFRNEKIMISNNMPFLRGKFSFMFNGELNGVKIKEIGETGAMKLFNFLIRFQKDGFPEGLYRAQTVLEKRSKFIRGLNYILSDGTRTYISNYYNQDPEYFTLYINNNPTTTIVSSEKYGDLTDWIEMGNRRIMVI